MPACICLNLDAHMLHNLPTSGQTQNKRLQQSRLQEATRNGIKLGNDVGDDQSCMMVHLPVRNAGLLPDSRGNRSHNKVEKGKSTCHQARVGEDRLPSASCCRCCMKPGMRNELKPDAEVKVGAGLNRMLELLLHWVHAGCGSAAKHREAEVFRFRC